MQPKMLSILGGCTTRDIFRISATDELVYSLWARMTVPSIMAAPVPELMYQADFVPEDFETRQSFIDVNKLFFQSVSRIRPKILLVDFMSEIYTLGFGGDGFVTLAEQTRKRRKDLGVQLRLADPFSDERLALMAKSLPEFFSRLIEEFGTRIILHEVYQSESVLEADGTVGSFPAEQLQVIRLANRHLEGVYGLIRSEFPDVEFFRGEKDLAVADKGHMWGLSPFHFTSQYSLSAFDQLKKVLGSADQ